MLLSKASQVTVSYSIEQPHTGFACKCLTLGAETVEIKQYKDKIWCDFLEKSALRFSFQVQEQRGLRNVPRCLASVID